MNLVQPAHDFTNQDLQELFAKSEALSVRSINDLLDDVQELVAAGTEAKGIRMPWSKTHPIVRLRTKEISIFCGINGHRKSTLLNQIALWATQEVPVGIASLEMPVEDLARMMVTQASANDKPSPEWITKLFSKLSDRLWFYDRLGSVPPLEIMGAVHALSQKGCKLIVIDSLSMCRVSDDMERERLFMSELTSLAKALDVHIALVHHVRKPQSGGDEYVPTRFDVKGNGAIVDLCQNLFITWANKARARVERKLEHGMTITDKEQQLLDDEPDQKLIVAKQRHAEFEGQINLWHHPSRQFTSNKHRTPMHLEVE